MRFILIIFTLITIYACRKDPVFIREEPVIEKVKAYNIILIAGQSNSHYGKQTDTVVHTTSDNILQLGRFKEDDYQLIDATVQLQHHSASENRIGFGLFFAKELQNILTDTNQIVIIPCGATGSCFIKNDWNKGDGLYQDAIERVEFIMSNFPDSKLTTILWHQGETDAYFVNENYQENLDNFIKDIRADLNAVDVPFILGGMVPYWVRGNSFREQIQSIIATSVFRHEHCGYVNPEIPFIIEKVNKEIDPIHYDAKGQIELAKRYFEEYQKIIEE
ncbi:sialate O-acetylesterase [Crocinitomix catalasitica]|uniref:sialate O-acetylesterase n=1 Tax=Crocinitomix catalasitica TaxID=184607 RepID=UPI000480D6CB|nr:sialate O-acetylesterase [Crocinitomix catalasitica]